MLYKVELEVRQQEEEETGRGRLRESKCPLAVHRGKQRSDRDWLPVIGRGEDVNPTC